jgi:hypothetical protein
MIRNRVKNGSILAQNYNRILVLHYGCIHKSCPPDDNSKVKYTCHQEERSYE